MSQINSISFRAETDKRIWFYRAMQAFNGGLCLLGVAILVSYWGEITEKTVVNGFALCLIAAAQVFVAELGVKSNLSLLLLCETLDALLDQNRLLLFENITLKGRLGDPVE